MNKRNISNGSLSNKHAPSQFWKPEPGSRGPWGCTLWEAPFWIPGSLCCPLVSRLHLCDLPGALPLSACSVLVKLFGPVGRVAHPTQHGIDRCPSLVTHLRCDGLEMSAPSAWKPWDKVKPLGPSPGEPSALFRHL